MNGIEAEQNELDTAEWKSQHAKEKQQLLAARPLPLESGSSQEWVLEGGEGDDEHSPLIDIFPYVTVTSDMFP